MGHRWDTDEHRYKRHKQCPSSLAWSVLVRITNKWDRSSAGMAQEELTWPKAIAKVLGASTKPLHYKEITERIIAQSLRHSLGATPAATVNAQLAQSIKQKGTASPYIRVSKGTFAMRAAAPGVAVIPAKLTPDVVESEETEEQYEIVTSFGMFWQRSAVEWSRRLKFWKAGNRAQHRQFQQATRSTCFMTDAK